ncbi:MAG: dimethyl sulfoxide reductase anchor subunit family protein [Desulfitobacterium sp.]
MEHMALTIFSICIQVAIGIMVFVAIGRLMNKEAVYKNAMLTAAILGIVGVLASLQHLGRPLSALKSLNQFGSSWLSREIWFTAIFIGLTIVAVALVYAKPQVKEAITGLSTVAALVGLVDVYMMAAIYSQSSVAVWQNNSTLIEFYATAISMGAVLFLLVSMKEAANMRKIVALTVGVAVIIQVAAVVPSLVSMSASSSGALQSSLSILEDMQLVSVMKWLCILAGAGIALWMAKDESTKAFSSTVLSVAILLTVGQVVGRYVFYAVMVVSGVGLT